MEVVLYRDASVLARTAVQLGTNPHGRAIAEHLSEVHGLAPITPEGFVNIKFYAATDDHRAALVDGTINLADL